MIEAPKQQMLGRFSVFVRWVSDVKQGATGPNIRVRAVIGKQWSTIQIPMEIAPDLKKGDFIEVSGSVTALEDKGGASNYLFVEKFLKHIPGSQIKDAGASSPEPSHQSQSSPPGGYRANRQNQSGTPQQTPRRAGGYSCNQQAEDGRSSSPSDDQPRQHRSHAPQARAAGGYASNRNAQRQMAGQDHQSDQPERTTPQQQPQRVNAAQYEQPQQEPPRKGGYRSNRANPAAMPEEPKAPTSIPKRPIRGYGRNRARSQSY